MGSPTRIRPSTGSTRESLGRVVLWAANVARGKGGQRQAFTKAKFAEGMAFRPVGVRP